MTRPRPARHGERGAVMVETALIAGTILTLLVFSIQIGILGFLQLTADAASFVNAREVALGFTTTATTSIFPQLSSGNIGAPVTLPAPQPSVPINYGYNSPNATQQQNSAFNRNGGVSMMEPVLSQTVVSKTNVFRKFGVLLGVQGADTEAYWQECGIHSNIANDNNACGTPSNLDSMQGSFSGNYFTKGENVPPYYSSFNYMQHCETAQPWNNAQCASGDADFTGLGVAEYLTGGPGQEANWNAQNDGVSGSVGTSVFQALACHQRAFAAIAQFFAAYPNLSTLYGAYQNNIICQLYYKCQYGGTLNNFNNFGKWTGFNSSANAAIVQIYSWDYDMISGGYPTGGGTLPGAYPLTPENGC